jgi:outer membrane protein assembly factor BamB
MAIGVLLLAGLGIGLIAAKKWRRESVDAVVTKTNPAVLWMFEPPERGAIVSTPLVLRDRIYFGIIRDRGLSTAGAVYCLDAETGSVIWTFDDDGAMQQIYSSPRLADGRLYIGEGMHGNFSCKLYCLDATSGHKHWDFLATGHIESTPCVADGKAFFGAGDDGIYCLNCMTHAKLWQFQRAMHIDASPTVRGGHLFASSGTSRTYQRTAIFCLDTRDGDRIWEVPTGLAAWAGPAVEGDELFVGLGNGRILRPPQPPEKPAGAVLCLDAKSGHERWRFNDCDAVFNQPVISAGRVFFGSRDGGCYCLDRNNGKLAWRADAGGTLTARVAVSDDVVYCAAENGRVTCLDADAGTRRWVFDLASRTGTQARLFAAPVVVRKPDGARSVYVAAELANSVSSAAVLYCLQD